MGIAPTEDRRLARRTKGTFMFIIDRLAHASAAARLRRVVGVLAGGGGGRAVAGQGRLIGAAGPITRHRQRGGESSPCHPPRRRRPVGCRPFAGKGASGVRESCPRPWRPTSSAALD